MHFTTNVTCAARRKSRDQYATGIRYSFPGEFLKGTKAPLRGRSFDDHSAQSRPHFARSSLSHGFRGAERLSGFCRQRTTVSTAGNDVWSGLLAAPTRYRPTGLPDVLAHAQPRCRDHQLKQPTSGQGHYFPSMTSGSGCNFGAYAAINLVSADSGETWSRPSPNSPTCASNNASVCCCIKLRFEYIDRHPRSFEIGHATRNSKQEQRENRWYPLRAAFRTKT